MKRTSRILTLLLVSVMIFSCLAACAGGGVVGTWKLDKIEIGGMSMSVSDFAEQYDMDIDMSFEFKSDNTVTGKVYGETMTGTYAVNGNKVTVTLDGESMDFILDGNTLTVEDDSFGKMTLVKK